MIEPQKYREIWNIAEELAKKETEELSQTSRFKLKRRDMHIKQMLQEKGVEVSEED